MIIAACYIQAVFCCLFIFTESRYNERRYTAPPAAVAAIAEEISPAVLLHISAPRYAAAPHNTPAYPTAKNWAGDTDISAALR